jgi:uncharacterized protein YndB with AHSA1/START domain
MAKNTWEGAGRRASRLRRIVFTWEDPDWEGPTEVEVRFAAEGTRRGGSPAPRLGTGGQGNRGEQELRRRMGFRGGHIQPAAGS